MAVCCDTVFLLLGYGFTQLAQSDKLLIQCRLLLSTLNVNDKC